MVTAGRWLLAAAGRSWAAYLRDMGNDPGWDHTVSTARGPSCGHPVTGSVDRTEPGDQYAARHDGFTFFRSVTANPASAPRISCRSGRCPLGPPLGGLSVKVVLLLPEPGPSANDTPGGNREH